MVSGSLCPLISFLDVRDLVWLGPEFLENYDKKKEKHSQ